jgi:hypothetical protein
MVIRVALVGISVVAAVTVIGPGTGTARTRSETPAVCKELPPGLRHLCGGPNVSCTPLSDQHARWEAVFATEPTNAKIEKWLARAKDKGFSRAKIEVDTRCSNGNGVYEVATGRFLSRTAALALVTQLKSDGFPHARTEDS